MPEIGPIRCYGYTYLLLRVRWGINVALNELISRIENANNKIAQIVNRIGLGAQTRIPLYSSRGENYNIK